MSEADDHAHRGVTSLLGTWSGRLIVLNTLIFLAMSWQSQSFMMPQPEVLLRWGAKEPVLLAQGEWWRLITPVFVHIGILHWAFNNWAIYTVGLQIESLLGPFWFLLLYLGSGIAGNIASSLLSLSVSAGASGALFGLLGSGFLIERKIRQQIIQTTGAKPRTGVYTGMVIANCALGLMIPQIDNAAHIGGLFTGILLTSAMLRLKPNRVVAPKPAIGAAIFLFVFAICSVGAYLGQDGDLLASRYLQATAKESDLGGKYRNLTDYLRLRPEDHQVRLMRLKLLLMSQHFPEAFADFEELQRSSQGQTLIEGLKQEAEANHWRSELSWLENPHP